MMTLKIEVMENMGSSYGVDVQNKAFDETLDSGLIGSRDENL